MQTNNHSRDILHTTRQCTISITGQLLEPIAMLYTCKDAHNKIIQGIRPCKKGQNAYAKETCLRKKKIC